MTDIEIIEAFTRLIFRFEGKATDKVILYCAYDLIKQQKAEIDQFADIGKMYSEIKADAIKEFAERLKATPYRFREERTIYFDKPPITKMVLFVDDNDIDKLVKEMTEETP